MILWPYPNASIYHTGPYLHILSNRFENSNPFTSFTCKSFFSMMTSSNGNIFRVTGHLCGEFIGHHTQRPVTQSFDDFFDLRLNKRFSKQSWGWWFETPWSSLWCHCNEISLDGCVPIAQYYANNQMMACCLSAPHHNQEPLLLTWFNINPSMDK